MERTMSGLQRAVIRHTLGLVPSVEDMTNWGGDYLNGQAVVGASCSDNSTLDCLLKLLGNCFSSSLTSPISLSLMTGIMGDLHRQSNAAPPDRDSLAFSI